jgi:hypothetical protein
MFPTFYVCLLVSQAITVCLIQYELYLHLCASRWSNVALGTRSFCTSAGDAATETAHALIATIKIANGTGLAIDNNGRCCWVWNRRNKRRCWTRYTSNLGTPSTFGLAVLVTVAQCTRRLATASTIAGIATIVESTWAGLAIDDCPWSSKGVD